MSVKINLDDMVNKAIIWQKDEFPVGQATCRPITRDLPMGFSSGLSPQPSGFMVVTNQRTIFVAKVGMFSKTYEVNHIVNLEDIVSISMGKIGLVDTLILNQMGQRMEFSDLNAFKASVRSLFPVINSAVSQRKEQLKLQKEKELAQGRVQIVLDFSSLKEVMSKGGLIMTTYKCPHCGGTLEIPEAGKILCCKYCGTPIKPIDIFDKIKDLIQ
jgi:hypothetical protein